jgi:hypothetical protein
VLSVTLNATGIVPSANNRFPSSRKFLPLDYSIGTAGITCRNGSPSKNYWTKTSQGIKLVNALSEESVGQSNHRLEANPTTDSSLKPSRGECSPASRSPRAGFLICYSAGTKGARDGKTRPPKLLKPPMDDVAIIRNQANIGAPISPKEMERMAKRRFQNPRPERRGPGGQCVFGAMNSSTASTFVNNSGSGWRPRRCQTGRSRRSRPNTCDR